MKLINCPLNGPRNAAEFICQGEVTPMPAPGDPENRWAGYIYQENNRAGVVREWWMHIATAYWFIAERDTRTDEIVKTYPASEIFQERVELK